MLVHAEVVSRLVGGFGRRKGSSEVGKTTVRGWSRWSEKREGKGVRSFLKKEGKVGDEFSNWMGDLGRFNGKKWKKGKGAKGYMFFVHFFKWT